MKKILLLIICFSTCLLCSTRAQQTDVYFVGHSLVNFDMPSTLNSIALSKSKNFNHAEQIGIGANLLYNWDTNVGNEGGDLYQNELPKGIYEHFIYTEAVPLITQLRWGTTYQHADSFFTYARRYNPGIKTFIYETWHNLDELTPSGYQWGGWNYPPGISWRPRIDLDLPYWESIADTIENRHPGSTVFIVPAGQGLAALYDSIQGGRIPGVSNINYFFTDQIHMNDLGNYFIACIMYSCLFQESPAGATNTPSRWNGTTYTVPPILAGQLQEIAWSVVCQYPRSGASCTSGNSAPDNVLLSNSIIDENAAGNTSIGTFSTIDQNSGDTHTYSLVSGNGSTDNSSFSITGNTLRIINTPDYESRSSYSIRIRTTDAGGLYFEKFFTITVNDLEESAPYVLSINRLDPSPTNSNTVRFTISFNESVTSISQWDFKLITTGNVWGEFYTFTGSGANYELTIINITGEGTMRLDLKDYDVHITDLNGTHIESGFHSGQIYTFEHTVPVGTEVAANTNKINIYPNPFTESLYIDQTLNDLFKLEIINSEGIPVISETTPSNYINLENLPDGLYLLRIFKHNELVHEEKVVKY